MASRTGQSNDYTEVVLVVELVESSTLSALSGRRRLDEIRGLPDQAMRLSDDVEAGGCH